MKEYLLQDSQSKAPIDLIQCEIIGDALKPLGPRRRKDDGAAPFHGKKNSGRQKPQGWTRYTRATLREKLERYRRDIRSCIHLVLPFSVTGKNAESIFNHLQRWLKSRGIGAIGVCETPEPHFHIAVFVEHTAELEEGLRKALRRWWNNVLRSDPTQKTLLWEARRGPPVAIVKYLSKSTKGGRGVKGKAPWLTFRPYFTTGLPKLPRKFTILDVIEQQVLKSENKVVFDAWVELDKHRIQAVKNSLQTGHASSFQHTPTSAHTTLSTSGPEAEAPI